ncbi:MAG: ATP-grasp domain-containing protein [Oscillospiraceae bacterium]|nr:ATP-grasp domain-containing protein [Oscillospiraceae bacterium]
MKVYVVSNRNGIPLDYDHFSAMCGFREMGFEIIPFNSYDELKIVHNKEDIILGGISLVRQRLNELGLSLPDVDYPDELSEYLGRKIWMSNINTVNSSPELWPVFIKPVKSKIFTGRLVRSPKDLIGCGNSETDVEIYCSEPVEFVAEYRCFVRYSRIIDVRSYGGNWKITPDSGIIEKCVASYKHSPKGYALDFGVTDNGRTLLIEANATVSIGSYGLNVIDYAKLLSARWAELTGTEDECAFDKL